MSTIFRWVVAVTAVGTLGISLAIAVRHSISPQPSGKLRGATAQISATRHLEDDVSETTTASSKLDALREALLVAALSAKQAQPAPSATDPAVQASEILYQRLVNAPPDPQTTAKMERALEEVIDSGVLKGTAASFVCGSTLCRVELTDSEDSKVQTATTALTERLPKLFASAVVHPNGTGKTTLFAARNVQDLRRSDLPESDAGIVKAPEVDL
ncbi:MAG TPA: hypothetical protein VIV60_22785 [Polyangiaceae bacterium]